MASVNTYLNFARTMELQDMFWGAYYGSCTDKYGVQWMVNCRKKTTIK